MNGPLIILIVFLAFAIPTTILDCLTVLALRKVRSSIEIETGVLADMPGPGTWGNWERPLRWAKSNLSNLPTPSAHYAKRAIALARISDLLRLLMIFCFVTAGLVHWYSGELI